LAGIEGIAGILRLRYIPETLTGRINRLPAFPLS
jgi:hypothetical protein